MSIRFILIVKDRESENWEYPIEKQGNIDTQEPANMKLAMTQAFMGGYLPQYKEEVFTSLNFLFFLKPGWTLNTHNTGESEDLHMKKTKLNVSPDRKQVTCKTRSCLNISMPKALRIHAVPVSF